MSVAGLGTRLIEAGPPEAAEGVLLVHGNPGSRLDWADLVARVGTFMRAAAFDLPGFGQADKPAGGFDYTVPGYAAFIEAARAQLGLRRVHLVLHDFGGPFGLQWAADHLPEVASVTIINAPPVQDYRWYLLAKAWKTPLLGELVQLTLVGPTFRLIAGRGHPKGLSRAFLDRMYRDYDAGTRRAVLALYRATDARRMVSTDAATFAAADIPALVLWSTHDVYMATRVAYIHRAAFPSARIVEVPDRGHFLMAEDPQVVAQHVVPFLRQHVARPHGG
ncbi:MAG: alpha/beta hydrolase [Ardenticatenales bacterium]